MDAARLSEVTEKQVPAVGAIAERRVLTETETAEPCWCRQGGAEADSDCLSCLGTGTFWRVTSRTVQVSVPFEEAAAHAYIRSLHEHIKRAAATVDQAADMLQQAGQAKQAAGMRAAVQAILEPTEGQD